MIPDATQDEYIDTVTKRTTGGTWLALVYADVTSADTLATIQEVAVAGYARKSVPWSAPSGSPRLSTNSSAFSFSFSADVPSAIIGAVLVSVASGTAGTIRKYYALSGPVSPKAGDTITVDAGTLAQGAQ